MYVTQTRGGLRPLYYPRFPHLYCKYITYYEIGCESSDAIHFRIIYYQTVNNYIGEKKKII